MNSGASRLQLSQDLVLVGGGHTHALFLRKWGMAPLPGVRVTLVDPAPTTAYTGMLPGHVAKHYGREDLDIDLVQLCRHAGTRLVLDAAADIDPVGREVHLRNGPPVAYDWLSIDVGIHGALPSIPGLDQHGVPAKPLGPFADRWARFMADGVGSIAVIGGGIAGAELALAAAWRCRGSGHRIALLDSKELLAGHGDRARRIVRRRVVGAGIEICEGANVARVTERGVELADGSSINADLVIGAAGPAPHGWLARTPLATHEGYVGVDDSLRSVAEPRIFAVGDCAHMTGSPRDKAGVYAVRQAPVLFENLRAVLRGNSQRLKPYRPQKDYLKLVSLGAKDAVFLRGGFAVSGPWAWRLKDWIDRRFMDRLSNLPPMEADDPRDHAQGALADRALCAGCGAKAGRGSLVEALRHDTADREDVVQGIGDDAGILRYGDKLQVVSTDQIRGFTADPRLLARVATIHALGDIWAMGATPQAALLTLTLPRMSPRLEARTIAEMTEAVSDVLNGEGAALIGGHTAIGPELAAGLTVLGLCDRPIGQDGAHPGDVVILTKPLGTGTILAGAMNGDARGPDVARAWSVMARSSGLAATTLSKIAHAVTDVTGFGLANHLLGILDASGVGAEIDLSALPLLPGAERLFEKGIRSSLFDANLLAATGRTPTVNSTRAGLLYDPQTAGGLLAAVPSELASEALAQIRRTDPEAAIIGTLTEGPAYITWR